jgi:hypothetical protein
VPSDPEERILDCVLRPSLEDDHLLSDMGLETHKNSMFHEDANML